MILELVSPTARFCSNLLPSTGDFPFKVLQFLGFWSTDNWKSVSKFIYLCLTCLCQLVVWTVLISQLINLIKESNVEHIILKTVLFIPSIASVCRQFNLFCKKQSIIDIEKEINNVKYMVDDNETIKIQTYYQNRLRFMTLSIAISFTFFGLIHTLTSWHKDHLPMPIWIPHEINIVIPFWAWFIYTLIAFWIHVMVLMSYDLILSGHLTKMAMHLDILKYRFTIISQLSKCEKNEYLIDCIEYHHLIYGLSSKIQSTFVMTNSVAVLSVCLCLCSGIFKFTIEDNLYSLNTWLSVQFIIAAVFKWALQCWESSIVYQKSIEISDAAYNVDWMNFDKSTAKNVMIIIERSMMRPIIFSAFLSTSLSLTTLSIVLKISYNAYVLLKHVTSISKSS